VQTFPDSLLFFGDPLGRPKDNLEIVPILARAKMGLSPSALLYLLPVLLAHRLPKACLTLHTHQDSADRPSDH